MGNHRLTSGIVTLTTDFGLTDPWVAAIKGVLLSIDPGLAIVDVTHDIPPQDVTRAAYTLRALGDSFPKGTVHLAVVDPGVGSNRDAVVIKTRRYFYVGPDNGLFTLLDSEPVKIVKVRNEELVRPKRSVTFHGRDIFAPAAAHLGAVPIEEFGPAVKKREKLPLPKPVKKSDGSIHGEITYFDRFGNAFTNIPEELLMRSGGTPGTRPATVTAGATEIKGLSFYYQSVKTGKPGAIINGFELLEIFTPNGNARTMLGLSLGDPVRVTFRA